MYILDGLRVSTLSANVNFSVNYSFKRKMQQKRNGLKQGLSALLCMDRKWHVCVRLSGATA